MDEKKINISRWEVLLLLLVLGIAAFTRLYKIQDYMTFLGDEGRDALVIRDIVRGVHFPLIGPGTSVGNMYLGPLFYYLETPFLWLYNFSPVGLAVEVAIIGVLTVALLWQISHNWFGSVTALGISVLYALSPVVITYSRSSWNPNIMPFFALLGMFSTWKFWRTGIRHWLPVIAISLAFVLNSHYLGLLLFPTVGIYLLISKHLIKSKFCLLSSIILFLILMSPLVIFDMRHNWVNYNALKTFFTVRQNTVNIKFYKAIPFIWPIWNDIITNLITAGNNFLGQIISTLLGIFVLLKIIKKQFQPEFVFVLVWIGMGLLGLGLYRQHIYVHYYGFLFPAAFLLLGFLVRSLKRYLLTGILAAIIFGILLFSEIRANPLLFSGNHQLERTTAISEFINRETGSRTFNLALISHTNYDAGYRYIFKLINSPYNTIHDKLTDQLYVICEIPGCQPVGNPLWEVAAFGWAKIDKQWTFPWGVTVYRLIHNPSGT